MLGYLITWFIPDQLLAELLFAKTRSYTKPLESLCVILFKSFPVNPLRATFEKKFSGCNWRHSFATYHVALHRDPGNTALLISHKNQNILYEHYLGVATKKDAEQYFEIKPKV